jgi:sortase A
VFAQTNVEVSRLTRDARLRRVQWLTVTAGSILLGIYALATMDGQIHSRLALQAFASAHSPRKTTASESVAHPAGFLSRAAFAVEMPAATLSVPRLGLAAPVFEGTDALTLNRGLGRIAGTAKFGEQGNIGIAGHRDSFFRSLKQIAPGDAIEVSTSASRNAYVVDRVEIVDPSDVEVLAPRRKPGITLVTCYPFNFAGAAPRRFIVEATLRQPPSPTVPKPAQ